MTALHFISKVFEKLEPYIPLMQTLAWLTLIIIILVVFKKHLNRIIESLTKRLEEGAPIKVGGSGLEIGITPASTEEKEIKLSQEIEEDVNQKENIIKKSSKGARQLFNENIMAPYILAEEFALNKIAKELNTNIERDVKLSRTPYHVFDGVALKDQKFIAIEVKYLKNPVININNYKKFLDRINKFYHSLEAANKKYFSLIFVVVLGKENTISIDEVKANLASLTNAFDFEINFRIYKFEEIEKESNESLQRTANRHR